MNKNFNQVLSVNLFKDLNGKDIVFIIEQLIDEFLFSRKFLEIKFPNDIDPITKRIHNPELEIFKLNLKHRKTEDDKIFHQKLIDIICQIINFENMYFLNKLSHVVCSVSDIKDSDSFQKKFLNYLENIFKTHGEINGILADPSSINFLNSCLHLMQLQSKYISYIPHFKNIKIYQNILTNTGEFYIFSNNKSKIGSVIKYPLSIASVNTTKDIPVFAANSGYGGLTTPVPKDSLTSLDMEMILRKNVLFHTTASTQIFKIRLKA